MKADSEGNIAIPNHPIEGKELQPALCQAAAENSAILRTASKPDGQQASSSGFYTLRGPSGKGSYKLTISEDPHPFGFGMQIRFEEWKVMAAGDRLLLRYEDTACCSHWIAVLETDEEGGRRWVPWWVSPNAANMDDFEEYRMIDIEVVEEK